MVSRRIFLRIVPLVGLLCAGCGDFSSVSKERAANGPGKHGEKVRAATDVPIRILSTAPSITETLFALQLGERVVGVSDYCRYPAEAIRREKIGAMLNPNIERMVELAPDLVVLLVEQSDLATRLARHNIATLTVDHSSVAGILASFETLGAVCGKTSEARGRELAESLREQIAQRERQTAPHRPVRVMIAIDRARGTGTISRVDTAGNNPYFNELLRIAGGKNIYADSPSAVPTVSTESILERNPEIIIDLSIDGIPPDIDTGTDTGAAPLDEVAVQPATELGDWKSLGDGVAAVKNRRIYPIRADYATIPGPRFIRMIETLSHCINGVTQNE